MDAKDLLQALSELGGNTDKFNITENIMYYYNNMPKTIKNKKKIILVCSLILQELKKLSILNI